MGLFEEEQEEDEDMLSDEEKKDEIDVEAEVLEEGKDQKKKLNGG